MKSLMKKAFLSISLTFLIISQISIFASKCEGCTFLIYINGKREEIMDLEEFLIRRFGNRSIHVMYLNDNESLNRIILLIEVLKKSGVPLPISNCTMCVSKEELTNSFNTLFPLTLMFKEGRLKAIVCGIKTTYYWTKILTHISQDSTLIFMPAKTTRIEDDAKREIEKIFSSHSSGENVLRLTLGLALADSINPCTFMVFTALLLISLHGLGRAKAALAGISFILAVYICYYMLGLGLVQALAHIPYIDKMVSILGLIIGCISIMNGLKPEFKSTVPKIFRKRIEKSLESAYLGPVASFILGVLASLTLLPCSGGPYLVGLGLFSASRYKSQLYLLLVLYNIIFIMPLLIILLAVVISQRYVRRIKIFRGRYLGAMELISGLLLVIVCLTVLFMEGF